MAKQKPQLTPIERLLRSDGALCVTFVNTGKRKPLESYDDLLTWATEVGALDASDARRLAVLAAEVPGKATGAARRGRILGARLQRILAALVDGDKPAAEDLKAFNAQLGQAMAARRLDATGTRWVWGTTDGEDFERMLWPVLLSAANILTSADRHLVRQCQSEACDLLFVARGGGKPRRWCSAACCNRRTSRVHYRKKIRPKRQAQAKSRAGAQRTELAGYGADWQPAPAEDKD